MSIYISIIIVLAFSAFFSSSEIAFVSADRLRIELEKSRAGWYSRMQSLFFSSPGHFITTMLVGNNIVLVIYGLLMASLLEPWLGKWISDPFLVVLLQTIISTIIILICGEFIPKAVANLNPNSQIRTFAIPLFIMYILLYPITAFSTWLSRVLFRIFKIKKEEEGAIKFGKVDLDNYIEVNYHASEDTPNNEVKILQNALEFPDVKVRDCLVPRNEVVAVNLDSTKEELIEMFDRTGFSKIVVYNETIDNIQGYIHAIEMFRCVNDWRDHIKTTIFVPESISAERVMRMLMQKKMSLAIIVDELGGTAGIVTLEDIVEEIFGDIEDEHDTNTIIALQVGEEEYLLSGRAEIDTINEEFDLEIPSSDEYNTIAGLILHTHQAFPKRGEELLLPNNYRVKVVRATDNKIILIKLFVTEP